MARSEIEADERRWSGLMANAQAGDEDSYRQLLSELNKVTYRFLRSRFGEGPFIEDCVQESLITIHEARHTYDPRRPFRPWLFAIVRHKAIDMLRKQRTRRDTVGEYRAAQELLTGCGHNDEVEKELTRRRLLALLPEPAREVLVLTKFLGYSVAETAQRLGISESLVKVRVHRAIGKLRRELETEAR